MTIAAFFRRLIPLALICTLSAGAVFSQHRSNFLDPRKPVHKYMIEHWSADGGLPVNALVNLLQTRDGYLWVSTYNGLCRFDGLDFKVFNKQNVPQLSSNSVSRLLETSDGPLLVGTEGGGLLSYEKGVFKNIISKEQISSIMSLAEDSKKQIWIGTNGQGAYTYWRGKLQQINDIAELKNTAVFQIFRDSDNAMWLCTEGLGLIRYQNHQFTAYTVQQGLPGNEVHTVHQDPADSSLWIGCTSGLARLHRGKIEIIPELRGFPIRRIVQDSTGSLWLATQRGLVRRNGISGNYEFLDVTNSELPHNDLRDLCIDREQNLWISSYRSGLIQIKNGKFTNYTHRDGLSSTVANIICEYAPDTYLVGTDAGVINMIQKGRIVSFPLKTVLSNDKRVKHLFKDRQGNLWVSTYDGLVKVDPKGKETHYTTKNGLSANQVRLVYQTADGRICIGTRGGGMMIMEGEKFTVYDKNHLLTSNFIMSIEEDKAGNLWIGTNDAGLNMLSKSGQVKVFNTKNGLPSNLIFNITIDASGIIWLTTNTGITRMQGDRFVNYTLHDGLPDESIFDLLEDNYGDVWMSSSKGLIKVSKKQLDDFAAGKLKRLECVLYDKYDGMSHSECTGATNSLKASDGSLWFPSLGGVVMADPGRMPLNHVLPPVYVEDFGVDYQYYPTGSEIVIAPGAQRFVIDYSAPSFAAPSKIHFKCMLENFDEEWLEVGTDRRAVYTNLAPGKYTFHVRASNNDGIWNNHGASITFVVKPYFYQARWFWALCLVLTGSIIAGAYRWRVYQIEKRNAVLEALIAKRTTELRMSHDELLEKNAELEQQKEEILTQQEVIEEKNKKLGEVFEEIQYKNENITSSIQYAKRIQQALLPLHHEIQQVLPEFFILYQPRDIVSGDFYWFANMAKHGHGDQLVIVAADCTGHGVPGAFMSMAGDAYLNQIVKLQGITSPDQILNHLHVNISNALKQNESQNRDGMDLVICTIDQQKHTLEFGGAKNPLIYIQDGQLFELKGDRIPVGGTWGKKAQIFTKQVISIDRPTCVYLFSDGYIDQFGGEQEKKFTKRRLKELLLTVYDKPMEVQRQLLADKLAEWMQHTAQIDDILLIGFKTGG